MVESQTMGIRVPTDVLDGVDAYRSNKDQMSRGAAVIELVTVGLNAWALEQSGTDRPKWQTVQNQQTGAAANAWGLQTASKIAVVLGAERTREGANEFVLDGTPISIRCARPKTTSIGLTNKMRERIEYVIGAFQRDDDTFDLMKITVPQWKIHCHDVTANHPNHGRVTLLTRGIARDIGEDLGEVMIEG